MLVVSIPLEKFLEAISKRLGNKEFLMTPNSLEIGFSNFKLEFNSPIGITLFSEIKVNVITSNNPIFASDSLILIWIFLLREKSLFFLLLSLVISLSGILS